MQDALAQSSNTGFTDLAHRAGTLNIANMAGKFGVNLAAYGDGGSGLTSSTYAGQVGMALGIAPMTVNEQTQMLATIANNGLYHQAHVIKYWQDGSDGAKHQPKVDSHTVLTPEQDAQVQYAMEQTTIDGTAAQTVTYGQQSPGMVIGKTGTTTGSNSGFFIGSTSQYTLVVGMFTKDQSGKNTADNLSVLGGGGFGGYWPAKIWNSFAESNFSSDPAPFSTNPAFSGQAWNLVGKVTKPKPTVNCTVNGKKVKLQAKACPTPKPPNAGLPFRPAGRPERPVPRQWPGQWPRQGQRQRPEPQRRHRRRRASQGDARPVLLGQNPTPTPTATATCQFHG